MDLGIRGRTALITASSNGFARSFAPSVSWSDTAPQVTRILRSFGMCASENFNL